MKKTLQARMSKISEGDSSRIGATVDLGEAVSVPDTRERLSMLEHEYGTMLKDVQKLKTKSDVISKWKLADRMFRFLNTTRKNDINLESHLKTLTRDTGISRTELKYLIRFRKTYELKELDDNVGWSVYRSRLYSKAPFGKSEG